MTIIIFHSHFVHVAIVSILVFQGCDQTIFGRLSFPGKKVVRDSGVRRNFLLWGVSFSAIWWSFVFGVRSLWRHNLTSYSSFQTNALAKFVDIIGIFFYTHSTYFVCHCTEYKLSALQVTISEENKLNATTQQFITEKISGCMLKQGSKTHSSLRQSNLQRKNQAALMFCQIRAVEHRKCAAGLAGVHSSLQDRILLNYTRIESAHKARKKTCNFLLCVEVQQTFSFLCSLLRHYQMPECFYVKNCWFWARATVLSCYGNC